MVENIISNGEIKEDTETINKNENKQVSSLQEKKSVVVRNETKNVPKNYYKAILGFIRRNSQLVSRILIEMESSFTYE